MREANRPAAFTTRLNPDLDVIGIPAFDDNYLWVLHDRQGAAIAIDPGDARAVRDELESRELELQAILITHHHPDHIGGCATLAQHYRCPVYGPHDARIPQVDHPLTDNQTLILERPSCRFLVLHLPGHTRSHLAYLGHGATFVGDTLFSAGCGRLFEGSPEQMLHSLDRLAALPDATLVFCAHEYTRDNAKFALAWEPENTALLSCFEEASAARAKTRPTIPTTIGRERTFNPYLRCDQPSIRLNLAKQAAVGQGRLGVFTALRTLKNEYVARD